jgi:hypothetical protein
LDGDVFVNARSGLTAITMAIFALLVSSCGGGSVNTTPVPGAAATAPAIQSLAAFTTGTVAASVPAAAAVTLPTLTPPGGVAAGTTAIMLLAAQATGGVVAAASAIMSSTPPVGPPALSSIARVAEGTRNVESELAPVSSILFFGFSVDAPAPTTTLTFSAAPTFTVTLPSSYFALPGTAYYIAVYDPSKPSLGWQSRFETCVATASTTTLVCSATVQQSITVLNNVTYFFSLYAVSTSATAPTPAPSVSPTSLATNAPLSATGTVTLATGATVTIPALAGAGGTITLGTVSASTSVAVTTYLQVPPGLPNPGTSFAAPFFVTLTPATTVTISGASSAILIPPTTWVGPPGNNVCPFIEMYDTSRTVGWFLKAITGQCNTGNTSNPNNSASFSTTQSMTLTGGVTYAFAPYPSN